MKITCLDQDGKRQFRRSYDIDRIAVDLPNNADFLALQRELRSHENDNTIHSLNTEIFHDQLKNLQIADINVQWGHVTNVTQSIYGEKRFNDYIVFSDTFYAGGTSNIIHQGSGIIYGYDVGLVATELEIADGIEFGQEMVRLTAGLVDAGGGSGDNALLTTFITYNVTGAGYDGNTYHFKIDTNDPMGYSALNAMHCGVFSSITGNVNIPRIISFYGNAQGGINNYAFYGANGNIYNNGDVDITGVYKISGVTISGGDVFTMFENTFLSNNYFQGVSASTLIVSDITATNVSTSYFNTTHITTSNILSTNSSITYQSSTNLFTTYLSTAYLSTTNFLTTYLTATNIYASTVTTTGNIYCGASLTAVQTLIAKNGIQLDSGEYIGYGTTGAAPTGGLQFDASNNATFSQAVTGTNLVRCTASASTAVFRGRRSNAGGTAVASGNVLVQYDVQGFNGSGYISTAYMQGVATENHAVGSGGTKLEFYTTPNTTATPVLSWYIDQDSHFKPGTTNTKDIGTTAIRIREIYVGTDIYTPMISSTNILTTYLTSTNIYTSTITATSNVSVSGKVTASSGSFGTSTDYTNFEADGTMVMYGSATVYNDIQYAISSGRVSSANYPDWSTFNTNFAEYAFDEGDYIDLGSQELPHWWKEGTEIEFHIHWANSGTEAVDGEVSWKIFYTFAKGGSVFSTPASLSATTPVLTTHVTLTHFYTSLGTTTLSTATIGTQLKIRLYRGSADPITNDPFALQVGVHAIADTIGSRTLSTK